MKVCEKVKEKGTTTYNEVADELVEEVSVKYVFIIAMCLFDITRKCKYNFIIIFFSFAHKRQRVNQSIRPTTTRKTFGGVCMTP